MKNGLIHLYTGEGKGKTTAAVGLFIRAYGQGLRPVLVQFLKGRTSGEISVLESLENVTILRQTKDFGFFKTANEESKAEITRQNNENLKKAYNLAINGECDLLILDEICAAYNYIPLNKELIDNLITQKPDNLELVLTGRDAPPHFFRYADYVTEFVKQKHPYDSGIYARKGIEF